jgi:hypothetical protein
VNTLGAVVYLVAVSPSWAIPEERATGLHSVTGEPFVWASAGFPILAVFLALNLIWGAAILSKRQRRIARLWLATSLIWIATLGIDFAHH